MVDLGGSWRAGRRLARSNDGCARAFSTESLPFLGTCGGTTTDTRRCSSKHWKRVTSTGASESDEIAARDSIPETTRPILARNLHFPRASLGASCGLSRTWSGERFRLGRCRVRSSDHRRRRGTVRPHQLSSAWQGAASPDVVAAAPGSRVFRRLKQTNPVDTFDTTITSSCRRL